jgi:electron transfer flavoprotein beta subunit
LTYEINESDQYALEAALQLKERLGGEVIALSLGPARVQTVIKEALARGADRGLHLEDGAFEGLDAYGVAVAIAAAAQAEGATLVLTGLQSDDHGYAQTGVIVAERLGVPHATIVMDVQVEDGKLRVKRELESGYFQWVTMPTPAVLTIQSGINTLRYATLKGIMAAKKKELRKVDAASLALEAGALAVRQEIRRIYIPQKSKQTQFLEGSPAEVAAKLVEKLKNEARIF